MPDHVATPTPSRPRVEFTGGDAHLPQNSIARSRGGPNALVPLAADRCHPRRGRVALSLSSAQLGSAQTGPVTAASSLRSGGVNRPGFMPCLSA